MGHQHAWGAVITKIAQAQPDPIIGPDLASANVIIEFANGFHTLQYGEAPYPCQLWLVV
jgi:hypothetical protein